MVNQKREVKVDPGLANHSNQTAFNLAMQNGQFNDLEPGSWVAFCDGKLLTTNADKVALFQQLEQKFKGQKGEVFVNQVGVPEEIIDDIPTPLFE